MVTLIDAVVAPVLHNNDPVYPDAVNTELPQLLTTVTVGAEGVAFTVSVAALELTLLTLFVQTARYCLLLSAVDVAKDKVALVAPVILFHVVPFVLSCHCIDGAGVPLAADVKIAFVPAHFVCEAGCVVTEGAIFAGAALLLISKSEVLACWPVGELTPNV
jgi:hypothetical protein